MSAIKKLDPGDEMSIRPQIKAVERQSLKQYRRSSDSLPNTRR